MEARATFVGGKGSKTFIAAVMVLLALGVGGVGGYVVASLGGAKATAPSQGVPAAKPAAHQDMVPGYILQEITPASPAPRLSQDSPEFIAQYAQPAATPTTSGRVYDAIPEAQPSDVPGSLRHAAP